MTHIYLKAQLNSYGGGLVNLQNPSIYIKTHFVAITHKLSASAQALVVAVAGSSRLPDYIRNTASNSWAIVHNSGKLQLYKAYNQSNQEMECDVVPFSVNITFLRFLVPVKGYAINI